MKQTILLSSNKKIYSDNLLVSLYILTIAMAFTTQLGDFEFGYRPQLFIGFFWICFALLKLFINGFKFRGDTKDIPFFLKLYILPHLVIHLYSVILIVLGKVDKSYLTTNATVYVPTLLAILSIYLFGKNALKYNCVAFLLSWIFSVGYSLVTIGPHIFSDAIRQGYLNVNATNYLELHDLVLSAGYVAIFYMFSKTKYNLKDFLLFLLVILIMILGIKRISAFAIILIFFYLHLLRLVKTKKQYKLNVLLGILLFFFCYLFIYLAFSGDLLYKLLDNMGVSMKGRNYYYNAILSFAEFNPSFIGLGRNAGTRIMTNEFSYFKVGGVHSDIIKMYVENGFIMFGLWLWYYIFHLPKAYKKHYGYNPAILCFLIILYTFILYFTDNTEVYFICQIFSIIIPMSYAIEYKKIFQEKVNITNER